MKWSENWGREGWDYRGIASGSFSVIFSQWFFHDVCLVFFPPPVANAKCVVITLAHVPHGGENHCIFIL